MAPNTTHSVYYDYAAAAFQYSIHRMFKADYWSDLAVSIDLSLEHWPGRAARGNYALAATTLEAIRGAQCIGY